MNDIRRALSTVSAHPVGAALNDTRLAPTTSTPARQARQ
jgi:hypothetical protein